MGYPGLQGDDHEIKYITNISAIRMFGAVKIYIHETLMVFLKLKKY